MWFIYQDISAQTLNQTCNQTTEDSVSIQKPAMPIYRKLAVCNVLLEEGTEGWYERGILRFSTSRWDGQDGMYREKCTGNEEQIHFVFGSFLNCANARTRGCHKKKSTWPLPTEDWDHTVPSILCPFSKDKTHLLTVNPQCSGEQKGKLQR